MIIKGEGRERSRLGLIFQNAYWRLFGYTILGGTLPEVQNPYLIAERINQGVDFKMIQLPDSATQSLQRLLDSSQQLHAALVRSPMWEFVKNEPVILQWISALNEVDIMVKQKESQIEKNK